MTDPSPSSMTDTSSGSIQTPIDLLGRPPIKRARPQLSCTPCRQGKLKCNREHPVCDQCSKRARGDACQYMPPPPKNKQAQNMRGRIRNLESLVVNLINQKSQEADTKPSQNGQDSTVDGSKDTSGEPVVDSFGKLRICPATQESTYVSAGHWSAVLKEIEDVKDSIEMDGDDDFGADDEASEEAWSYTRANARSTITFGMPKPMTKRQLIEAMPPKDEVDRLLPLWFNSADPLLYVIHAPTFQAEYKQFWADPSSTPVMWLALLYSAMALGIILGPRNPGMTAHAAAWDRSTGSIFDEKDSVIQAADKYQQLASSAMVLADIAKPQPYTLETLMVYGECEFLRRDDHHGKIFLLNGMVIRVALRMGYHRDPSHFSGLSPIQGEMRRRIWHVLNMMDVLVSFAIGLPSMVRRVESDVRAPRNLYDSDLDPNATELPRGRPLTELTPATYTIAKSRICSVFAEAAELSQRVVTPKYSDVTSLEKRLKTAHDLVPEGMRVRPMEESITDPPVLIMGRYNIELLYLKTRLVLHRNYLTAGQSDSRFEESRRICVETALEILTHQNIIYHACEPGGQLNKVWWYMSSLSTYDFLLAAMVLCLELNHLRTKASSPDITGESPQAEKMLELLENTYQIWSGHQNRFRECLRGAEIIRAMLHKCAGPNSSSVLLQDPVPNGFEKNIAQPITEPSPPSMPEEITPQIWGSWPSGEPSIDMIEVPSDIDWTLWDNSVQGRDHIMPVQGTTFNNITTDTWNTMTTDIDAMLNTMPMPQESNPFGTFGPTFYSPDQNLFPAPQG